MGVEKWGVGFDVGSDTVKGIIIDPHDHIEELEIRKTNGRPLIEVKFLLEQLFSRGFTQVKMGVTGSGGEALRNLMSVDLINESAALAAAFGKLYPEVKTIIEIGRESQQYILLEDDTTGQAFVADYDMGNKCQAGSGSFLDQMWRRLNFDSIEHFTQVALETPNPYSLAGRCGVFTESDITHAYADGITTDRIAAGIHKAIARNYRTSVARRKEFLGEVAFIGGVSENPAMWKYLSEELELDDRLFVPRQKRVLGAIGVAMTAESVIDLAKAIKIIDKYLEQPFDYPACEPIKLEKSEVLEGNNTAQIPLKIKKAYLGLDAGSVSNKAALLAEIDGKLVKIASYYGRTNGNQLHATRYVLDQIHKQIKDKGYQISRTIACVTGSGRYLIANYIGAELVRNEIAAQASGCSFYFDDVDEIFEIGGQDSKYIQLDNGVVVDFEMNRACAAGTGAFFEKQSVRLGIELPDFGDLALRNTRPCNANTTCAILAESAMVHFQQNNVSKENLAGGTCIAVAKAYLNRTVAGRPTKGKVVFQGAVAFNKGMIAAFETLLGKGIVVPPDPHLTGPVGAARLAYLSEKSINEYTFRGFEEIENIKYNISSKTCDGCAYHCNLSIFEIENGPKFVTNDRCEKFSGAHKKNLGAHLPDLFAEREKMLMSAYAKKAPKGAAKVGVPRGLMFSEYYPLYAGFLGELGFDVVPSDPTNRRIIEMGLNAAIGEPCFPFKVSHGHYLDLIEKGIDIIFAPGIISAEQPNPKMRKAQTCPYLQAAPDILEATLNLKQKGVKLIANRVHYDYGLRHLQRVFTEMGKELGKTRAESLRALDVGLGTLRQFRQRVEARGKEVLDGLDPDQIAFVVSGRPYTLWDPALNMGVGKKVQDMGVLAFPQDYLPLDSEDLSKNWPNAYSRQIQKKLAAAMLIRKDPRLRAVVLSYFACGPDSFGNPFFKDEIGEPCYIMQIDEHTADAGVITRLQAFRDTVSKKKLNEDVLRPKTDYTLADLRNRKLWIPDASESTRLLAASFQAFGINAQVLPRSPDIGLSLGRKAIPEDVCLPMLMTTEDLLNRVNHPNFDPDHEAFFQGNSEGPCRFGMYEEMQRRILTKLGHPTVPVVTLGIMGADGGLGIKFPILVWDLFVAHDLLYKMVLRTRPYESEKGASDKLFKYWMNRLVGLAPKVKRALTSNKLVGIAWNSHLRSIITLLKEAQHDFASVRVTCRRGSKPLIGVVGEFFVRLHDGANQDVVRKLEAEGAEVWLAPATEFFAYANFVGKMLSWDRLLEIGYSVAELKEFVGRWFNSSVAKEDEHALFDACLPYLEGYEDIGPGEVIRNGRRYVDYNFGGEAICSVGKSEDLILNRKVAGMVSVIPFNCMPGNAVTALSLAIRQRHSNIPFLNMDYDGYVEASRDIKIDNFMIQTKSRHNKGHKIHRN